MVTYSMITLLVFSSLMSVLILRSLNRSILKLEGATRRIAEGDLDFELPARGNDQIASLTRSFDSMRRALKEEYARRSRFIMGVSHDLRTPLTLIQGYVEAIADGFAAEPDAPEEVPVHHPRQDARPGGHDRRADRVREDGDRGVAHDASRRAGCRSFLLDNARRFAEDAQILKREFTWSVDVPETCSASAWTPACFPAPWRTSWEMPSATPRRTGSITMTAAAGTGRSSFPSSDTGIGIPKEDVGRIFDPFYRGTNSRREQGFGLGLTTVRSIIESHGWNISVHSAVGQGTTFTIRMPVTRRDPRVTPHALSRADPRKMPVLATPAREVPAVRT